MKIKKGDTVLVIKGKDRLKSGKVIRAIPKLNKIIIEGINLAVKHLRPRREGQKGQKILKAMPISVSNVKLICPKCKKPTRIGYKIIKDEKYRFCKKCKKTFS